MLPEIVAGVAGVLLIWLALRDVFQTAVVPRAPFVHWRASTVQTQYLWRLWPRIANLYPDASQEDVLANFAPFNMIIMLLVWAAMTGFGFGLIFYTFRAGLHPQPLGLRDSIYFAYTTMLTIGFGDISPVTPTVRILAIFDGAVGLGLVAVVTSYLFSIFGSFANREKYVIALGARAGTPPSGSALLETHGYAKLADSLPQVMRDGQRWAAMVAQSQIAFPTLCYFRSNDKRQSWVGTLGLLLDAATLIVTTVDDVHKGEAELMLAVGRRAAHELVQRHHFRSYRDPGCAREHFDVARKRLAHAGFTLRDADASWHDYTRIRETYGPELNTIAKYYRLASIPWSDKA